MDERLTVLGFSLFSGIGPRRFAELLGRFGTALQAWNAEYSEFESIVKPAYTKKFFEFKKTFDSNAYLKLLEEKNAWFVTKFDEEYPNLLRESHDPPLVLFGKGNKKLLRTPNTIGVVGTRKVTTYGRQVTTTITTDLVNAGFCIVSGLAMGVDAVAHATALGNNGTTIAVLGCGVDCCNPMENYSLYTKIIEQGSAVVSEFPLSQPPTKGSFPSRNRIIAGLSKGVVVTEGADDSGALITAHDAFSDNRPVFAVPGPITSSLSKGSNELLKKGGNLVLSSSDILSEFGAKPGIAVSRIKKIKGDSPEEEKIITALQDEEQSFDDLRQRLGFETAQLNMLLSLMEMKGYISLSDSGNYIISQ